MYKPVFLRTENQLNKVLKQQKRSRQDIAVLFLSLWDPHSKRLVKLLKDREHDPENKKEKLLYVVDSFTMPHAFVIFKTTKIPHLVQFRRGNIESEDYLLHVYEELGFWSKVPWYSVIFFSYFLFLV